MGETLPPLRVREVDGDPNAIPVYEIILSDNLSIQQRTATQVFISASTSTGASGPTYAATGNNYVVMNLAADLTAEHRLVQSGNSITVTTASGLVTINATTADISGKQDLIGIPLIVTSGGTGLAVAGSATSIIGMNTSGVVYDYYTISGSNNTSVIRSGLQYIINTLTSGAAAGVVYAATGNSYVVMNLAGDLTAEHRLVQSGNSITISTAAGLVTINAVTNGIIYAPTGGEYLTYAANATLTSERVVAASDNITIVSSGTSFLISATTGTQVRTIRVPMALATVEVNSGNAFWTAQTDGTRMDKAYINHVDSGRSVSTWWCMVPTNLNSTPNWNLDILSETASLGGTGGFLVLNVDGMSSAHSESANVQAANTIRLVSALSFLLNTAGLFTMSTMHATGFDVALGTSATDYVKVKVSREGQADTLNSDWYLYSVMMRCDVDT